MHFAQMGFCAAGLLAIVAAGCRDPNDAANVPQTPVNPSLIEFAGAHKCPRPAEAPGGAIAPTDDNPEFAFNGEFADDFDCTQSGPVRWPVDSTDAADNWYIQNVDGLIRKCGENDPRTCRVRALRLCSKGAAYPESDTQDHFGPCKTKTEVGPAGCEVCFDQKTVLSS
ncbi:hypothetical protein [Sphingomonas hankyongi]|uniref:Uncharacterized protein n=1 Tax=Sphingomonas hankyongi TaxID=2908209 RepID=A0ABT0S3E5_9SPHN|nr:hypothetical protein [Sphingomonas hankyongi]MCL6730395.1 hypothetical protein [Sphingomonas hankyongi]